MLGPGNLSRAKSVKEKFGMKKLNTFGVEKAVKILGEGKYMIRVFNTLHASMGGVNMVLFGPSDVKYAKHFAESGVVFAYEHEVS